MCITTYSYVSFKNDSLTCSWKKYFYVSLNKSLFMWSLKCPNSTKCRFIYSSFYVFRKNLKSYKNVWFYVFLQYICLFFFSLKCYLYVYVFKILYFLSFFSNSKFFYTHLMGFILWLLECTFFITRSVMKKIDYTKDYVETMYECEWGKCI